MTQVFVIRNGVTLKRFTQEYLIDLGITYNANAVPTCNLTMSMAILPYLTRRCELRIEHCGESILLKVNSSDCSIKNKTVSITTEHIFAEWEDESVPVNVAIKGKTPKELLAMNDFKLVNHNWEIRYDDSDEQSDTLDYEFSRENKSEALNKMLSQTETLLKRFPRNEERTLEIGVFGERKNYRVPNVMSLDDISMEMDSASIVNMVVPLSDKGDGGASSLTLRDSFVFRYGTMNEFPIVLTGNTINTQSTNTGYLFPQYAPNNKDEYAVLDTYGIELEDGDIYEGTYSANDLQPIQEEGQTLSNEDRLKASNTLYKSAIRYLKNHRRQLRFTVRVPELPDNVDVLDKVKFSLLSTFPDITSTMTPYEKKIYEIDDWFYITEIQMTAITGGWNYTIQLAKDLAGVYGNGVN